jgi:hypothetical protein
MRVLFMGVSFVIVGGVDVVVGGLNRTVGYLNVADGRSPIDRCQAGKSLRAAMLPCSSAFDDHLSNI